MRTALAVAVIACLACEGPDEQTFRSTPANGGSTVVITGDAYPPAPVGWHTESMAVFEAWSCANGHGQIVLAVELSWVPGMCRMYQQDERHPGTGFVTLRVNVDRLDGSAAFPLGTHAVSQGAWTDIPGVNGIMQSWATLFAYGPMCHVATELGGTGTYTITEATAERVAGSVDFTFSDGSTAVGTFSTPVCDELGDVCQGTAIHRVSDSPQCLP
jgi:hypothetical protein